MAFLHHCKSPQTGLGNSTPMPIVYSTQQPELLFQTQVRQIIIVSCSKPHKGSPSVSEWKPKLLNWPTGSSGIWTPLLLLSLHTLHPKHTGPLTPWACQHIQHVPTWGDALAAPTACNTPCPYIHRPRSHHRLSEVYPDCLISTATWPSFFSPLLWSTFSFSQDFYHLLTYYTVCNLYHLFSVSFCSSVNSRWARIFVRLAHWWITSAQKSAGHTAAS